MMKDWLGAVPKLNKVTIGLIHGPRDWQWQIQRGSTEITGGHYEILRSERGKCQNSKYRACSENSQVTR